MPETAAAEDGGNHPLRITLTGDMVQSILAGDTVVASRIPKLHVAILDAVAAETGASRSTLVRQAVAEWVTRKVGDGPELQNNIDLIDVEVARQLVEARGLVALYEQTFRDIYTKTWYMLATPDELEYSKPPAVGPQKEGP